MKQTEYKKNDCVTITIEDMGSEGEGIGKVDGFTLFVKDTVPGDRIEARIVKLKKSYAYGRLEKVLTPSPFRVEPECPFHRQCGGCQLQTYAYEKQLEFKQDKIRNNLIRIGAFDPAYIDARMEPIIGMEEPYHYRNKAQYPVGTDREGRIITGFYAGRTHTIIANTDCCLGVPENTAILQIILDYMRENHVTAYEEATGKGLVRHVLIRKGFTTGEIMVCLVINRKPEKKKKDRIKPGRIKLDQIKADKLKPERIEQEAEYLPYQDKLVQRLSRIKGMTSVSVSINTQQTNVIMGTEIHTIWGQPVISDTIHVRDMRTEDYPMTGQALTFHISPLSFYQVNPVQTEKLYSLVLEYAGLTGRETVWDLYCGIGTISLFLAGSARKVYGVEIVPEAIRDARENAARNGIANVEFFVGKAEEVLPGFYNHTQKPEEQERISQGTEEPDQKQQSLPQKKLPLGNSSDAYTCHPDVIVVDPPRKGCDPACLDTMLKMQPERIIYVSCDSATLARDLRVLCDGGYELRRIRGVDQFAMTVHVEVACCLQREDKANP